MKIFAIVSAAVLVAGLVTVASADDHVSISNSTLATMGFGGGKVLSDVEGQAVRGKGYHHAAPTNTTSSSVGGSSTANYVGKNGNNATSTNNYDASSKGSAPGGTSANGGSLSFAGNANAHLSNNGSTTFSAHANMVIAGGGAFASAH